MQATFNTTIQLFLRLFRLNLKLESNLCRGFTHIHRSWKVFSSMVSWMVVWFLWLVFRVKVLHLVRLGLDDSKGQECSSGTLSLEFKFLVRFKLIVMSKIARQAWIYMFILGLGSFCFDCSLWLFIHCSMFIPRWVWFDCHVYIFQFLLLTGLWFQGFRLSIFSIIMFHHLLLIDNWLLFIYQLSGLSLQRGFGIFCISSSQPSVFPFLPGEHLKRK